MTPIMLRALDPQSDDLEEIDTAFYLLAEAVGLDISGVRNHDTYLRMTYGHQDMYGRIFRFMVDVLASIPNGESKVTLADLARRYALRTGCTHGQNVFVRDDYEACNVAALMADLND